jgi:hypothetical protein
MHTAGLGFGADGYVGLREVPAYRLKTHDSPLQIWEGSGDVIVLSGTPPNLACSEAHFSRGVKSPLRVRFTVDGNLGLSQVVASSRSHFDGAVPS